MRLTLHLLYNVIVVPTLAVVYALLALVSTKARHRWQHERMSWKALDSLDASGFRLWFHAASMGEFEQLKPVVERCRSSWPDAQVIVSFSSASGYRNQRLYAHADAVVYAPFDSLKRVHAFLDRLRPTLLVVSRYDLWWNMMHECRRRTIPVVLVNATYTRSSFLGTGIGRPFYRELMNAVSHLYCVNESSYSSFEALGVHSILHVGTDTRYDRLAGAIAQQPELRRSWRGVRNTVFQPEDFVLILGSVWKPDLELFLHPTCLKALRPSTRLLIVPHEMHEELFEMADHALGHCMRWSGVETSTEVRTRHGIVDTVGQLLNLYAIADAAYIGGGFGAGVHSVAEAACYGMVVSCGPKFQHNADAVALEQSGGLQCLRTVDEAVRWLEWVQNPEQTHELAQANAKKIASTIGTSDNVVQTIAEVLSR